MRVVYLNPTGELGGGERSLLDLLAAQCAAHRQIEPSLIVCADGPLAGEAKALGASVSVLPMPDALARLGDSAGVLTTAGRTMRAAPAARNYARALGQAICSMSPDLVHSNGMKTHLLASLAGLESLPVVWHVRDFISARGLTRRLLRWGVSDKVSIVANSRATADDARRCLGDAPPIHVVYNGVDTAEFAPGAGDGRLLDQLADVPPAAEGTLRVGLVATYARWKGQDVFIDAAAEALKQMSGGVRFYVVGGPIYRTAGSQFTRGELESRARKVGVASAIAFVPFQTRPADVYRALDIVVHASTKPEPFGRTIVEAMACGRAVIAAGAGGASELFRDGHEALATPPGDVAELAGAMCKLAGDRELRARLGAAGRATAVERFGRELMAQQVTEIQVKLGNPLRPGMA